jgi:uncharacterized membrane protein YedE/YeeE
VLRLFITLFLLSAALALGILLMGGLARVDPIQPVVAVGFGVLVLLAGLGAFRSLVRNRPPETRPDPEEVGDLEVYFVCTECGTEFRVERLGELQVPRHCGEPMRVERRVRASGP